MHSCQTGDIFNHRDQSLKVFTERKKKELGNGGKRKGNNVQAVLPCSSPPPHSLTSLMHCHHGNTGLPPSSFLPRPWRKLRHRALLWQDIPHAPSHHFLSSGEAGRGKTHFSALQEASSKDAAGVDGTRSGRLHPPRLQPPPLTLTQPPRASLPPSWTPNCQGAAALRFHFSGWKPSVNWADGESL